MTRIRDIGFGLSRELWLVPIAIVLNALDWGTVLCSSRSAAGCPLDRA